MSSSKPLERGRTALGILGLTLLGLVIASFSANLIVHLLLKDQKDKHCLLLGDSAVRNYRLAPGQDLASQIDQAFSHQTLHSANFAWPGSSTADMLLAWYKAETLGFQADVLVIGISPSRLLHKQGLWHTDELGWVSANPDDLQSMWPLWDRQSLNTIASNKAYLTLFGWYEALEELWRREWKEPGQREALLHPSADRQRAIEHFAADLGKDWSLRLDSTSQTFLQHSNETQTLQLITTRAQRLGLPVIMVLFPDYHPALFQRHFDARAKEAYGRALDFSRAVCHAQAHCIDLSTVPCFQDPQNWDDTEHIRNPACYALAGQAIAQQMQHFLTSTSEE